MELKDTMDFMTSTDYRERFIAEYWQTKIRYEKLKAFNNKIWAATTEHGVEKGLQEPEHDCPFNLLREQELVMAQYLETLEKRAAYEKIDLTFLIRRLSAGNASMERDPLKGYDRFCAAREGKKDKENKND